MKKANRIEKIGVTALVALLGTFATIQPAAAQYKVLHTFTGDPNDGASPNSDLTISGSTLYGMTCYGGKYGSGYGGYGVIFKMNRDGSGYTNIHSFAGGPSEGSCPLGSLTLVGSKFYGMTFYGGPSNMGVIFKINIDGTGYTNLHSFAGYLIGDELVELLGVLAVAVAVVRYAIEVERASAAAHPIPVPEPVLVG